MTKLMAGIAKHFGNVSTLTFGGATVTVAAFVQALTAFVALMTGVDAARAAFQAKLKEMRAQAPATMRQIADFVAFVRATFGNEPDVLADFGLAPHKGPTHRKVEDKALAVEKAAATREARHTVGPRKRKAIKGTPQGTPPATGPRYGGPPGASLFRPLGRGHARLTRSRQRVHSRPASRGP